PRADLAGAAIVNFGHGSFNVSQPAVAFNALQGFAIAFRYEAANDDAGCFGPGETVTFELDAAAELTAAGFADLGGGPAGGHYYAGAHVIAVAAGTCIAGSGKIGDTSGEYVAEGGRVNGGDDRRLPRLYGP